MTQPTPGGNVNPANLNFEGLNARGVILGTDLLIVQRPGEKNVKATVSQIGAIPGPVNIADLVGGVDNDMLFKLAGIWTATGGLLTWDGSEMIITGTAQVANVDGPAILNEAAGITNPTLIPDRSQLTTGVGGRGSGFNEVALIALSKTAAKYESFFTGILQTNHTDVGLTASVTQTQGGALQLNSAYNEIATVANVGDAIRAAPVDKGERLTVINNGANQLQLFPLTGDDFGAGVNASITVDAGHVAIFLGRSSTFWDTVFNGSPSGGAVPDPLLISDGLVTAPGLGFTSETDTGLFRAGAGLFGIAVDSIQVAQFKNIGLNTRQLICFPGGVQNNSSLPSLAFGDGDTGFHEAADDFLRVSVAGTARWGYLVNSFQGNLGGSPQMHNEVSSLTNPTLIPNSNSTTTGIGGTSLHEIVLIAAGRTAAIYRFVIGTEQIIQTNNNHVGLTAGTTQTQAGGLQLVSSYNEISVCANVDDTVVAPSVAAGMRLLIINNGANRLQVFPFLGDDIGAGVNAAIFIESGALGKFIGQTAALWDTLFNGSPSAAITFPELVFDAGDFENPNNADWDENALAPAIADSNNAALTVRAFDDTIVEGVGGYINLPDGAVSLTLSFVGRAETAPGGVENVRMSLRTREVPDNGAIPAWATDNLANFDIPTNENFQFDSETFTFATLGYAAGELIQFELVRVATIVGTDLTGDYDLLQMKVNFA